MIKFAPSMWQKILGIEVIDPDGWDRGKNFESDWAKLLTFTEFLDKCGDSTCSMDAMLPRAFLYLRARKFVLGAWDASRSLKFS